ncbi:MAG TPA: hypothetical protein VLR90_14310, partial [Blastocatellia bacterium]|nr:hypothetical protein [Blastocatellia bacterium]
ACVFKIRQIGKELFEFHLFRQHSHLAQVVMSTQPSSRPYILPQSFGKESPQYHPLLSLRKKLLIRATKGATFAPGKRIEISRFGKLLMDMESDAE